MNNITRDGRVVSTPLHLVPVLPPAVVEQELGLTGTVVTDVDTTLAVDPVDENTVPRPLVTHLFGVPITPTEAIVEVPPLALQIERLVASYIDPVIDAATYDRHTVKAALSDFATEILTAVRGGL